ncbi:FKBP-type peptidyl-prolyl cis-trans isomerase [Labilibaculum sp. DW002]|uniref:Peptidyl-prolyl cis-trans isomerase n=1 Tax=Paralabilibaculum antarcticum TaxID=2912572 RepID=A0ABT5VMY6_9BACT|nr:FKBP-type peptidyl-prolyl cis-trans isomerase [Labilibaculum sp. DW002]MDE5416778.1 FKBP-type peptidyl-prolyl cis-trans isomerase [Labilibaculum sp. DW002]
MTKSNFKNTNEEEIKAYIAKNKLDAKKSDTGLYYVIANEGEGARPTCDSNITISYIGYLTNGTIFDQSESLEINLSVVIEGWKEGIQYFKEGGEGILIIPSHLAYGKTDYGSIPGGSVLIFDILLTKVF